MNKFKSILVAAVATAALTSPALATGGVKVYLPIDQAQWSAVYADLDLYGAWIDGDVTASSVAIGNNAAIKTATSSAIYIRQLMVADVGATLDSNLKGVGGDVGLTVAGICNNASVSGGGGGNSTVKALQQCNTLDPYAIANVAAEGVGGDFTLTAAAIGNNMSATITGNLDGAVNQRNVSAVYSNVNAAVSSVGGDVAATAAAIGNNISITQGY
jgi:hypothetical protein